MWKNGAFIITARKISVGFSRFRREIFCGKLGKLNFSTRLLENPLLITKNFVERFVVLSLQRKNQRNSNIDLKLRGCRV